jgi:hypothetical protein
MNPTSKDIALTDEFKEARAAALNGAVEAMAARCITLRMSLHDAEAKIAAMSAELEQLRKPDADR